MKQRNKIKESLAIHPGHYKSFNLLQDIEISKKRRNKLLSYIVVSTLSIIYFCAMSKN